MAIIVRPEIPPRVRRRVIFVQGGGVAIGNTSACAEKRLTAADRTADYGKYLRVCGEEFTLSEPRLQEMEIPPRVRRREMHNFFQLVDDGNTSACAEKSGLADALLKNIGKYLRVCGEELPASSIRLAMVEIPPRVRRRGN